MKKAAQVMLLALLAACSTGTSVTGAWQGEKTRTTYDHVLVVGVSANSRVRRSFEVALSELLRKGGTKATAAVQAADGATVPTAENVAALARSTGADAVLVTRLAARKIAAKESETRVGVKTQQPTNLNGGAGLVELFSLEYNEYEEPGELTAKSTVVVESSLYDQRQDGRLVYVVTTTAQYREDRDDVIASVTGAIAGQLRREGLVR
jgi:hypothetical protein